MPPIKLIIADDQQSYREAIGNFLNGYNDIELVHEAANGIELIECLSSKKPDVVLLDISMPEMDGFETLKQIRIKHKLIKVLMLSMYDESCLVEKAKEMGANGYLYKNTGIKKIRKAICRAHQGKPYYLPTNEYGKSKMILPKKSKKAQLLSHREQQIISCIAQGLTHAETAQELKLSKRTVDGYKEKLLRKLELKNEKKLIAFAFKNGLV